MGQATGSDYLLAGAGELTFDAMTWWMGELERAIVCGMDCGSRGASGG